MTDRRGFLDEPAPVAPAAPPVEPPAAGPGPRGWVAGGEVRPGLVRHEEPPLDTSGVAERGAGSARAATLAVLGLVAVAIIASLGNSLILAFQQAAVWGGVLAGMVGVLAGILGWAVWREWRGYVVLDVVDTMRRDLQGQDAAAVQGAALAWLRGIRRTDLAEDVLRQAADAETVRALLRGGPIKELEERTVRLGRAYGFRVLAATAVCPWPGLDGLVVVWQSIRMVREIALIHGMRPGTLGSAALLRRAAMDAGVVVATDMAVTAAVDALLSSLWVGGLAGQAAGSAVAARRIVRLALVTGAYCRPL